jgi:uncharacterized protein (TIGR02453 family)
VARDGIGRFAGFGARALDFYEGLSADNSRAYWQAHEGVYRADVAAPLAALAAALEPEFGPVKVFRPYRDLRFSRDKRPYQEHASVAAPTGGPRPVGGLYLALSADGLLLAGGYHTPERDQLDRFRRVQDDDAAAADLDAALARLATAGYPLDDGAPLASAPRGWRRDHPRIDLLRRTSLVVGRMHEPEEWVFDERCLAVVVEGWRTVREWTAWLDANVGPSRLPPRPGR